MTIKEFRIKLQMLALTIEGQEEEELQLYQMSESSVDKLKLLIDELESINLINPRY